MLKWQRNYKIVFEIGERKNLTEYIPQETITVTYPHTLRLNISNGINFSEVSKGSFQILNLSQDIQAKLWKDSFNVSKYITMWVYAGYRNEMPLIYMGDVLECYSYREEGAVDWITEIKTSDGTYLTQYGFANTGFVAGTKFNNLLEALLADHPTYKLGYITAKIPPLKRDRTFIGQTLDILGREYGGYEIFIDKGELNILDEHDVVPSDIQVITAESGLLGSPRRSEQYLNCTMLFEPGIKLAQAVKLVSDSIPWVNNIYKVVGVSHQGVISPVESGKLTTTLQLYLGTAAFEELKKATSSYGGTATTGIWDKPVKGKISSAFGPRKRPIPGASTFHKGIDIAAPYNTPIIAPANGKVSVAHGWNGGGYGNFIIINNGVINGKEVTSLYGHLKKSIVTNGQQVYKGQTVIGYVGSTGNSDGSHLHFEIKENGKAVKPQNYTGEWS